MFGWKEKRLFLINGRLKRMEKRRLQPMPSFRLWIPMGHRNQAGCGEGRGGLSR